MNKEHFKVLLEDLYDKYNHSRKSEVPNLIEKYNGQEFDAIKTFYFKYNFKSHPSYDIKAGTDSHIKGLIDNYSNGKRPIKDNANALNPEEESLSVIEKKTEQASSLINNVSDAKKEELLKVADEKIKSLETMIQEKEKKLEQMIKKIDDMIEEKAQKIEERIKKINEESIELFTANKNVKIETDEHVEIKINLDYAESDIELPKEVSFMAAGTRFLMVDHNKKMLAFEIKEIFCDYVSYPGKCIKEINIQRI
jgi:hypothetical protein